MRIVGFLAVMGCVPMEPEDRLPDPPPTDPTQPPKPRLANCTGRAFTPDSSQGWRHLGTNLTVSAGAPRHDAADALVTSSKDVTLAAKFTYGVIKKDLEDENIRTYIDDCSGWHALADVRTDSDGVAHPALDVTLPDGIYDVKLVVLGDGSIASATMWILPRGTHLALFDIDGTLTTDDAELIIDIAEDIYDGDYVAQAYPGAIDLVSAHAGIGHIPVFMTGRPRWLSGVTRTWLADLHAPIAPLILAPGNAEALPFESGVGDFKLDTIAALEARGFIVDLGHGNASTDIYAYLGAGLPATQTWIIGEHAAEQGTQDPGPDWVSRAAQVATSTPIAQPFVR
jgi:hypothetical protein